jgi:tetratricopeptide (TPR) repeat protein
MAQPATNPKIEELRFRLKTDPKSRLFYQLAEELRRAGQFDESERVLRTGLSAYPAYLAAWVSLGRVLRELKNEAGAIDALDKALQLDPGNVVAARLMADAYLALGDKVEAIKKYKLVHALLPSDETLEVQIEALERDLGTGIPVESVPEVAPVAVAPVEVDVPRVFAAPEVEESPFDKTVPPFGEAAQRLGERSIGEEEAGSDGAEPMAFTGEEDPFGDAADRFGEATAKSDAPAGVPVSSEPVVTEMPVPVPVPVPVELPAQASLESISAEEPAPEFMPAPFGTEPEIPASPGDAADTITMADLYARQGLIEEARHIYENILARDPGNREVQAKLATLGPGRNPKVAKLEQWLAKMSRREVGRV